MMKPVLEICCGSFSDVKTAYENGADRVELNSALYMGGLTPTLANLIYAKEKCNIPVVAMVRPRGGGCKNSFRAWSRRYCVWISDRGKNA